MLTYVLPVFEALYIQAADKPKRRRLGNSALEENNSFIHFSPYKVHLFVFLSHTPPSPYPARKILFCSKFFLIFSCLHCYPSKKVTLHYNLLNFSFLFSVLGFKRRIIHSVKIIGFFLLALFLKTYLLNIFIQLVQKG